MNEFQSCMAVFVYKYYLKGRWHKSTTRQDCWTHDHMVSYMWCVGWGLEGSWLVWLGIFCYFLLIFIKYTVMEKKDVYSFTQYIVQCCPF